MGREHSSVSIGGHMGAVPTNSHHRGDRPMTKTTTPDMEQRMSDYENLLNGDSGWNQKWGS